VLINNDYNIIIIITREFVNRIFADYQLFCKFFSERIRVVKFLTR